ncbi:hypothetical protein CEXT_659521 [Caerostris extrusa]|uniref:Uncharacterized protein n=1 Tax=Caerostris extrusa TaxID=172846 RepID=A0AAV4PF49_CAEEX|nr:hypothetical protein CEXT_659521 [Caerostris extrusa]
MNSKHIPGNVKADLLMTEEEPVDYRVLDKPAYPDIINEDQNNIDMLRDKICIDNQQVSGIMNSKHIPGNVKADLLMTEEEPVDYRVLDKPAYPDIINEDQKNIDMLRDKICIDNQQVSGIMNSKHIPGNVKADLLMTEEEPVDYRVLDKPAYPDIINEDQNNIGMLSDKICIDNQQVSGIMNSKHIPGNVKADLLMTEEEPVDYRVLDKPAYPDIINEDQNKYRYAK